MTAAGPLFADAEFAAIEAALQETQRGRLFLADFARRRRDADVARLIAAAERLEAQARGDEVERSRRREQAERAAEVMRELTDVLNDLRPLADARVRARALGTRAPEKPTALERRFARLVELDEHDAEAGLTRFG